MDVSGLGHTPGSFLALGMVGQPSSILEISSSSSAKAANACPSIHRHVSAVLLTDHMYDWQIIARSCNPGAVRSLVQGPNRSSAVNRVTEQNLTPSALTAD